MKINLRLIFFSVFLFLLFSCSQNRPKYEQLLGTICVVNLYEDGKEEYYNEIFARLEEIDHEFGTDKMYSDISRINARADVEPVTVGDDVFKVIETALKICELTDGAFDISIEPAVNLWLINSAAPHIATQEEIDNILPLIDYKNIVLNPVNNSVYFRKEGMRIDLGGIAKGYAADEVAKICRAHKIRRAVIDLGGNIYVYGKKKKNELWNVGIKNPEEPDNMPLLKVELPQTSVVTSGIYERFFMRDEKFYHHILSPASGYPVDNELSSVTVICDNSMLADGLTTAFFVMGTEKSVKLIPYIEKKFNTKISALFFRKDKQIVLSDKFSYEYTVLYDNWTVKS